jgi:hypothetical protein
MTTSTIREKLYDYIRVADDKKVKAIYTMLEDEITETNEWWKNNAFVEELDTRFNDLDTGIDKGVTTTQLKTSIDKLRKKRYGR